MKDLVSYEDFLRLDIRMAKIVEVEEVEGADKLLKLTLDVGDLGTRTVVAGIKEWYKAEDLEGRLVPYLANLEPRVMRGVESAGMVLAADDNGAVLLHPDKEIEVGSLVR